MNDPWRPVRRIPTDAPPLPTRHPVLGAPDAFVPLDDRRGRSLGYVARFRSPGRPKPHFRPCRLFAHAQTGWRAWIWSGAAPKNSQGQIA